MRRTLIAILAWSSCHAFGAQAEPPLFSSEEMLRTALTAPLAEAFSQKKQKDRLYLEGRWSYRQDEATVRLPVKIRTRGNFRRVNCALPPLQLNFRKKTLDGTLLDGQDKLKMVSPCGHGEKYQQLIYLEYLVYRLFALFSDYHFRTRLVEVGYVDTGERADPWQSVNFLIEDVQAMAARSGAGLVDIESSRRSEMDLGLTALVEVFQFMIGNVDYSTLQSPPGDKCCHNVKLLARADSSAGGYLPVPYDFDSAGIINAPYATVPEQVPIKRVTQRYFTGWCKEEYRFREAISRVNAQREGAIAVFEKFPLLEKKYRKKAVDYLDKSYQLLNDEKYVKRYILGRCRGEVIPG
jgi:hypothetical protein